MEDGWCEVAQRFLRRLLIVKVQVAITELFPNRNENISRKRKRELEVVRCCSACSGYSFIVRINSGDELRLGINTSFGRKRGRAGRETKESDARRVRSVKAFMIPVFPLLACKET